MEAPPSENEDLLTIARSRVRIGPISDWVTPNSCNHEFTAKVRRSLTPLLLERQAHAELHEFYIHHALRLETVQAVQLHSQWRVEFAPKTEWVVLHSVKTRRGAIEKEHLSADKLQFLRREAGLEGFIIDGGITLLLLLEDVAVGDVIEFSYTIKSQPRLLPEYWSMLFELPLASEIGKHYFSVRHAPARPMKWKSSSQSLAPMVTSRNGDVVFVWQGENVTTLEPEEGTPASLILYPWMQFSDCPDWQTVARAVAEAWPEDVQGDGLKALLEEIKSASPELLGQVNHAIKIVQDGFRYLSVNVELGGQIPADPETVIRRRYGDCKDLALLLSRLLRGLGVSARPVLVHGGLRKSVSALLPSPWFNHVIVEFEIGQERRWIDATIKFQGGGALNRFLSDFGVGLPVDPAATTLVTVPKASLPSGSYDLKDSFLLDTAGNPSHLAVFVTAKGIYAQQMRAEFDGAGITLVASRRLQVCANRFCRATRVGEMQWRDDRDNDEFTLVEVFEIDGFLQKEPVTNTWVFAIRCDAAAGMLLLPPQINRRDPFAVPFPCHQTHTVEIDFLGLEAIKVQPFESDSKYFTFSRQGKSVRKFLRVTFGFSTLTDIIPAAASAQYRKDVETTWHASVLHLRLPPGYMRIRKRGDFGALPTSTGTGSSSAKPATQSPQSSAPTTVQDDGQLSPGGTLEPALSATIVEQEKHTFIDPGRAATTIARPARRTHHRSSGGYHRSQKAPTNKKCLASVCLVVTGILMLLVAFAAGSKPELRNFAGLLIFIDYPTVIIAVVLAVLGYKECRRTPWRQNNGKMMAIITLSLSALLGFILIPTIVTTIEIGLRARRGNGDRSELLKFPMANFVFRSPKAPWSQLDVRGFNPRPAVSFIRPGPIYFSVCILKLKPDAGDPQAQVIGICKVATINDLNPFRVTREEMVMHGGINGGQIEILGTLQGREYYFINWLVATNGQGYALRIWGSPELTAEIKEQGDYMFSRIAFEAPNTSH